MPPKAARFISHTVEDFTTQLTRRNVARRDEESLAARSGPSRTGWFGHRRQVNELPELSRSITVSEEEKASKMQAKKMGTISGVFVPTTLNVLSILMFLRFGFVLGQAGLLGMLGILLLSYTINLVTALSLSAISSNGTVRGGGAYYLISRSLGPEFGGSIGLVSYLGYVGNTGMNAVGLVDCVVNNFGELSGYIRHSIPESFWFNYLYASVILSLCTVICLFGSSMFSRASNMLLMILLISTFSIPISTLAVKPFHDPRSNTSYTGFSRYTLMGNLMPNFTSGAVGSQIPGRETWQDLFGILYPATAGIFAGASMSGELKEPSKSIPKGTLSGLLFTFLTYTMVIVSMGATVSRETFYRDVNVIQNINLSAILVLLGEFSTALFSVIMGVVSSAQSLQALARDDIFPGFSLFGQGTKSTDNPIYAILLTFALAQVSLLGNVNTIASFVTMTYLMTFLVTNLACFLLKIGSAPNFRPSFRYFTWWTAGAGAVVSGVAMFFVDGLYASGCVAILLCLFLITHYSTPPKSWGDVSQSLIYHQVRKYLLRLRQEHVKFWRPQILLFVNDPRRDDGKLIQFCNAMKKGGLYIIGHILVTPEFEESFPEVKRQQSAWLKYIDFTMIKAFPQIAISPTFEWGCRSIALQAGLGGMRPNIAVMGFYNLHEYRMSRNLVDVAPTAQPQINVRPVDRARGSLPTDNIRTEKAVDVTSYLNALEDLLLSLQMNVAVAKGFDALQVPGDQGTKKYIDLWPIQMSNGADPESSVLTTNFDTYTLILQLGCILNTVPAWRKAYTLRVAVFVEYERDVREERIRVKRLLEKLRIQAEILLVWLACGEIHTYEVIINNHPSDEGTNVEAVLGDEQWWKELKSRRGQLGANASDHFGDISELTGGPLRSSTGVQHGGSMNTLLSTRGKRSGKTVKGSRKRQSISEITRSGVPLSLSMRTHSAHPRTLGCASESGLFSDGSTEEPSTDDECNSTASENDIDVYGNESLTTSFRGLGRMSTRRASTGEAVFDETRPSGDVLSTLRPKSESKSLKTLRRNAAPGPVHSNSELPHELRGASEEGTGPSITFAEGPIKSAEVEACHTGPASVLSFNDLPLRAQHLILNDLIKQHSGETAVIFTTLPSPIPGTWKTVQGSLDYLSALEILTADLPPVLLVHSSQLTVTTAL